MTGQVMEVPVLIVGAGPAGLTAAYLLARAGVRSVLLERHEGISPHPKARGVNVRTMELFRAWGLEERIRTAAGPVAGNSLRVWTRNLAGPERHRATERSDTAAYSPATACICPQFAVEQVLLEAARSRAASDIRYGHRLTRLDREDDGVTATVTGEHASYQVHARYLLGADGAHSTVRDLINVPMSGYGKVVRNLSIYFHADLRPYLAGRDLIWCKIENDTVNALLMPVNNADRWLLVVPAGEGEPSEDRCRHLVRAAIGADPPVAVLSARTYEVTAMVADRYRDGQVLLLGDAAHVWPPAGAFGMNTGIQDAHNLCWKLAGVLHGWAGPALLHSYEAERQPIARMLADRAVGRLRTIGMQENRAEPPDNADTAWDLPAILGQLYRSPASGTASCQGPLLTADVTQAAVGARAPHLPLAGGGSVLDHFGDGYALLTGPAADPAWHDAARDIHESTRIPLRTFRLSDAAAWSHRYGPGDTVALVRPDGYLCWSATGPARPHDLRADLTRLTGRR